MGLLFLRQWRVTIGDVDMSNLDFTFKVMRSTKREPNTCELVLFNLSDDTRGRIEAQSKPQVTLRAGYGDEPVVLFVGSARRISTTLEAGEFSTMVQAQDGGKAYSQGRMLKAYRAGTPVSRVLRDAVNVLGVGVGNLSEYESTPLTNGARSFPDGYVATGPAHRVLDNILRGAGLRWSVQNNAIQIMRRGQALQTQAVRLAPDSGLIASPTQDEKGLVSAVSLIQPGLDPGRRVTLDARLISGTFEVRRAEYSGDTAGADWYVTLELKAVS